MKVHHIGYLVKNIEKSTQSFLSLGYREVQPVVYDPIRKIDISFIEKDGYCVELISPKSEDSVVSGLMKRYKNSPYHICYTSTDFEEDCMNLQNTGWLMIDQPVEAEAFHKQKVVFFMHSQIGMIELIDGEYHFNEKV